MTRRSYLESKLAKREEWAEKATVRAESRFKTADTISERFAGGQPILIGHHSERGARADQERIYNAMSKGVEESKMAAHHASSAVGIAHQLDHSIFSDDDNALEAIEARIAEREAQSTRMVTINKAYRKVGNLDALVTSGLITPSQAIVLAESIKADWRPNPAPYATWELSNLRGRITADKQRIKDITARNQRTAEAEAAGGVTIKRFQTSCFVTFAEKPDRTTIDALKAAGFYWQGGGWAGAYAELPEGIEPA